MRETFYGPQLGLKRIHFSYKFFKTEPFTFIHILNLLYKNADVLVTHLLFRIVIAKFLFLESPVFGKKVFFAKSIDFFS
jgi:hypothetical protein